MKNYVALGDSISTGYGLTEKEHAFTNLLADALSDHYSYYNYAVDGNTSNNLIERLLEEEVIQKIENAEIITITIGGNDILHLIRAYKELLNIEFIVSIKDFDEVLNNLAVLLTIKEALKNTDLQTPFVKMLNNYELNLSFIIGKIKAVNKNTRILVQTVYNPSDGIEKFEVVADLIEKLITSINEIILRNQGLGYEVIDTYRAFKGNSLEFTNINLPDIHPSMRGHRLIYHMIYDKVRDKEWFDIHMY